MIIGNNKPGFTKPFENVKTPNKNNQFQQQKNIFTKELTEKQHINPLNKNEMSDKTLALLHQRLQQGTITLDEFNKKCEQLGKRRQN